MKWGTLPKTFWRGILQSPRDCLWVGTHLVISSPDGLSIPIVLVKIITSRGVIYSLWSAPWAPIHLGYDFQSGLLLCPSKYQFICSFFSSSLLHTNKSPLPLPCILCGVSNALTILITQTIFPEFQNASINSNGGVYCSDLLLT